MPQAATFSALPMYFQRQRFFLPNINSDKLSPVQCFLIEIKRNRFGGTNGEVSGLLPGKSENQGFKVPSLRTPNCH